MLAAGVAAAGEWDFSGSAGLETRLFVHPPAHAGQDDAGRLQASVFAAPEIVYDWNDGDDRLTLEAFLRYDEDDARRSHSDLRAANWLHAGQDWDLVIGLHRVFWGVIESRHLVDIVNQTDGVEDIDAEDKLGQPMINLNLDRDWGRISGFVMSGFRERSFASGSARLGGPIAVDTDRASFESGAKHAHPDLALRWFHSIGKWDIGLAHFWGTSRAPRLIATPAPGGGLALVPRYDLIHQTSADVQLTTGAWLLKLEALTRSGHGDRFAAASGGLEYTFYQLAGGRTDLGLLAEYHYDGRDSRGCPAHHRRLAAQASGHGDRFAAASGGLEYTFYQLAGGRTDLGLLAEYHYDGRDSSDAPATFFDHDVFAGARLTLNDEADSAILIGAIVDRRDGSTLFQAEAVRRVFENWKVEIEARIFAHIDPGSPLAGIRDDDFVALPATRFF